MGSLKSAMAFISSKMVQGEAHGKFATGRLALSRRTRQGSVTRVRTQGRC